MVGMALHQNVLQVSLITVLHCLLLPHHVRFIMNYGIVIYTALWFFQAALHCSSCVACIIVALCCVLHCNLEISALLVQLACFCIALCATLRC